MANLKEEIVSEKEVSRRTIRSFIIFILLIAAAVFGWKWLNKQPEDNGIPKPLRAVMNSNESLFKNVIYNDSNISKTYLPFETVAKTRVNGEYGMGENFNPATWVLNVVKKNGDTLHLSIAEIKTLPKTDIIFDFKCIEGWSQVTRWGGVKFSDFIKHFHLSEEGALQYAGLSTPDKAYYVGIDRKSMMNQQTILCYEMNGKPLPFDQGAPLRLIIPVKYGIKHLKRIGTLFFSNSKPPDYWYERGYDYYSGL
jgi:DMSO/TMAO reductase YedYZ molybdopterin-dependent catalytic subunit